jgi:hypothetical protein
VQLAWFRDSRNPGWVGYLQQQVAAVEVLSAYFAQHRLDALPAYEPHDASQVLHHHHHQPRKYPRQSFCVRMRECCMYGWPAYLLRWRERVPLRRSLQFVALPAVFVFVLECKMRCGEPATMKSTPQPTKGPTAAYLKITAVGHLCVGVCVVPAQVQQSE